MTRIKVFENSFQDFKIYRTTQLLCNSNIIFVTEYYKPGIFELDPSTRMTWRKMTQEKSHPSDLVMWIDLTFNPVVNSIVHVMVITQARVLCLIYTHDAHPRALCVYIRQSTSACVITNMLHFRYSKICPNFIAASRSLYIVMGTRCDCGILFLLL